MDRFIDPERRLRCSACWDKHSMVEMNPPLQAHTLRLMNEMNLHGERVTGTCPKTGESMYLNAGWLASCWNRVPRMKI